MLFFSPMTALAAEHVAGSEKTAVPIWLCIPFAGLLLCIAVLPLIKAEWWEEHQPHAVIFWSLLFIVPFALSFSAGTALETVLECIVNDYLTFIILLFGLFCVSRQHYDVRGPGRLAQGKRGAAGSGDAAFKLDRHHWRKHADDPPRHQDEFMEKKETPHYCVFYFSGFQHRRLSHPDWGSAPADGLYERCPLFLEFEAFSASYL